MVIGFALEFTYYAAAMLATWAAMGDSMLNREGQVFIATVAGLFALTGQLDNAARAVNATDRRSARIARTLLFIAVTGAFGFVCAIVNGLGWRDGVAGGLTVAVLACVAMVFARRDRDHLAPQP